MNDASTTQHTEFVLRRVEDGFRFGGQEYSGWLWFLVLLPIVLIGIVYVVGMYVRDGRTIGWFWAGGLAVLRIAVYMLLAFVFLLPAVQSWDETRLQSRAILLYDVSDSMDSRDEIPEGKPIETAPTRRQKLTEFLLDEKTDFLGRILKTNPAFSYRFGGLLDENYVVGERGATWTRAEWEERRRAEAATLIEGTLWPRDRWAAWLRPEAPPEPGAEVKEEERAKQRKLAELIARLRGATNVGDSALTGFTREANNMLQGIVLFSDGRSTEGSPQALRDLVDRARKAKVPVFTVAVGTDRPPVRIDITDLQAPDLARPEDEFPVRVVVNGEGLPNQEVEVALDVYKPGAKEKSLTLTERVRFKPGEPPSGQAEFKLSAAKHESIALPPSPESKQKPLLELGDWRLVARVARHRQEVFVPKEHVSDPATVKVVERPLRVLLFAGGFGHDYQFVRSLFVRETDAKRAELSLYAQPAPGQSERRKGIVQDVPAERLLTQFPTLLEDDESKVAPDDKYYNLMMYDAIVAFDPDWTQLSKEQLEMVERWVFRKAGGLIVLGGPINTVQLARPGANKDKLKSILDLYPVILQDNRILDLERNATEPFRLSFPGATPDTEFLRLDEDEKLPMLAGWELFFTGAEKGEGGPNNPLVRGFYNYYPVERAKDSATVVTTLADPRARLLSNGKEQPFLVTMPYGSGKTVWITSMETRRLRQFREAYFERFWTKLARYAASGSQSSNNKRVTLVMGRSYTKNQFVHIEARIDGRDGKPLAQGSKPKVTLKLPPGSPEKEMPIHYELTAKPGAGEWSGWFGGRFLAKLPGEFGIELKVPETGDVQTAKFIVKDSNPELDNSRPDFETLYLMASEADEVLARVPEGVQKRLREALVGRQTVRASAKAGEAPEKKETEKPRLYFDLKSAEVIPDCMVTDQKTVRSRGPVRDLWDEVWVLDKEKTALVLLVALGVLLVAGLVLGAVAGLQAMKGVTSPMVVTPLLIVGVLLAALTPLWILAREPGWGEPQFAILLAILVPLLSLEWLTRKLLKLA